MTGELFKRRAGRLDIVHLVRWTPILKAGGANPGQLLSRGHTDSGGDLTRRIDHRPLFR